jgi:hypothetical protein
MLNTGDIHARSFYRRIGTLPPVFKTSSDRIKKQHNGRQDGIDLATIAGLTQWVDQTTHRIGKRRTEAIVEGLCLIERLSPGIEDFLLRFIQASEVQEPQRQIKTKDYLTILAQLEGLLGQGNKSEMALISILSNGKGGSSG